MQIVENGYRGISLVLKLNRDRLFALAVVALALCAGAYLGTLVGFE